MKKLILFLLAPLAAVAGDGGVDVVVIYNTRLPASKQVAEYYAERRQVPAAQVWGLDVGATEAITRKEYAEKIQAPLLKKLESSRLWTWGPKEEGGTRKLSDSRVRYAVLCYGIPTKFLPDTNLVEKGTEKLRPELRRTEASVDSQLACLPLIHQNTHWAGAVNNASYMATNAAMLHPTNGIFLVTRLDGPSPEVAARLVDRAMMAETNGLWGRAYFDSRGLTNGAYVEGDDWIRAAATISRHYGFETELDQHDKTFGPGYPLSQIAFYFGWYDWNVSGPFTRPEVEFMPGAVAYHLHSFSAQTLRSTNDNWTGPLLAKGATATIGNVDEPYLAATMNIPTFFHRFVVSSFSFGEAVWASMNALSWQAIAIGDPLYRPFARKPEELHKALEGRASSLVEWSHVRVVNFHLANETASLDELISYLETAPVSIVTRQSAVMTEKLGDLYWARKKLSDALDAYEAALSRYPSPQQKKRLLLLLAQRRSLYGPDEQAIAFYKQFIMEYPDYPEMLMIYHRLLLLAKKVDDKAEIERCEREIERLSPRSSAAN